MSTDFFGDVIFAYTDQMALDDGVLVDIESLSLTFEGKPINRITAALFWQERPKYPLDDAQLAEHLADCGDDEEPINIDMEALGKAMAGKLAEAISHSQIQRRAGVYLG